MAHQNYYLDLCVDTFIVNGDSVLLRLHEKYNLYLARGTLQSLCDKELLEYSFEDNKYNITELGRKVQAKSEKRKR